MNNPIILNNISENDDNPYFFKNSEISKKIYIAQKAKSEDNALYILDVWNNEKFNIGDVDIKLQGEIPFTRFLYNTNMDIKRQDVYGGNINYSILYYKKNDKINYIALLEYN